MKPSDLFTELRAVGIDDPPGEGDKTTTKLKGEKRSQWHWWMQQQSKWAMHEQIKSECEGRRAVTEEKNKKKNNTTVDRYRVGNKENDTNWWLAQLTKR